MMSSVVIPIPSDDDRAQPKEENKKKVSKFIFLSKLGSLGEQNPTKYGTRRLVHSIKVGIALVVVSLFYILDPLYEQVKENAIWAIMTIVVIFEFYAGATLSKGFLRVIATTIGGGMGTCVALLAQEVAGTGNDDIVVGCSVFIFGAFATFYRLNPQIKKRYDYGVMISILTFSMVVVSGLRGKVVMNLARERLSAIAIGFAICIFISLLVFPIWSGDEFHHSMKSNFETLASAIEGCLEEYFKVASAEENQLIAASFKSCKLVLNSKSKDELMANFAKWEPWHGKFGLSYPWKKYIQIGDILREMAAIVLSLNGCLQSPRQSSSSAMREMIKEPFEAAGISIAWALRELKESMTEMRKSRAKASIVSKMHAVRVELSQAMSHLKFGQAEGDHESVVEALAISSFAFSLMDMVKTVEKLVKEVEELGELAGYQAK